MMTKAKTTLGRVCTLVTDGTHDTPRVIEDGYPLIKAKEITSGWIDFTSCDHISLEEHLKVIARSKPEYGDTLFAHIGASLGATAYVNTVREFSIKNIALFKPNSALINSKYLYYYVRSSHFQNRIKNSRTGSAQPFLSLDMLRNFEIEIIEDKDVQIRVSSILSAYDDLIENNTRRIQILEEMAQAIYREWFVNFHFPGHAGIRMVESELGMIPEGWQKSTIGAICKEVRRNISPENIDQETPYIGLEHIPRHSLALSEWGTAKDVVSTKLAFGKNEILFGKIRPYFHKVGPAPVDGVCSSDTIVIHPSTDNLFGLTLMTVFSDDFVSRATLTSQGTKMPRANWEVLQKYPVVIPSEELLLEFNRMVKNPIELIQNLLFQNRNLRRQRDLLLPHLIKGESEDIISVLSHGG